MSQQEFNTMAARYGVFVAARSAALVGVAFGITQYWMRHFVVYHRAKRVEEAAHCAA